MSPSPDPTDVVAAIDGLRSSVVIGIALVLFVIVAGLVISFGRRR